MGKLKERLIHSVLKTQIEKRQALPVAFLFGELYVGRSHRVRPLGFLRRESAAFLRAAQKEKEKSEAARRRQSRRSIPVRVARNGRQGFFAPAGAESSCKSATDENPTRSRKNPRLVAGIFEACYFLSAIACLAFATMPSALMP